MKHKVCELEGAVLDAAVGKALGLQYSVERSCYLHSVRDTSGSERFDAWRETPSTRWEHGGPIIEREQIVTWPGDGEWRAASEKTQGRGGFIRQGRVDVDAHDGFKGPTPLIAAMRAYVASKFGEEVELQ